MTGSGHWKRQPYYRVGIDLGHPLAFGLVHAWNLAYSTLDLVGGWHGATVAGTKYDGFPGSTPAAPLTGIKYTTVNTDYVNLTGQPFTFPTTSWTQLTVARITDTSVQSVLGLGGTAYNDGGYPLVQQSGTFYTTGTTLNQIASCVPSPAYTQNTTATFVVTRTAAAPDLYINQQKTAFNIALTPGLLVVRRLGGLNNGVSGMVGNIALVLLYNYAMEDGDIRALIDNPWQIFKHTARRIYVGVSPSFNAAWNAGANTVISSGARTA